MIPAMRMLRTRLHSVRPDLSRISNDLPSDARCWLHGFSFGVPHPEFTWAFAQNLDNSFHPNELCRESLAQSLYLPDNQAKTIRQGGSDIFLFTGTIESYRIYAFKSQAECELALTNMKLRQRQP